jgi:transposase
VSVATIERVRQRFVEEGLESALCRKKQDKPSRERKLDGAGEARLLALACSKAPRGRVAWTLQMLADALVELKVVDSICPETVRQTLQKTRSSRG